MKYEYYKDKREEWRWRLKAVNGQTIAVSGEGYVNKADALHGIDLVKSSSQASVEEVKE
ncbi:DUF1508 domain-containing protein [uncultured Bartonella sp.]|uniref:YegP family protein n=1 Tax=uncultured Bartonella sp. TaxID=104108 RepID=UPI002621051C|nr:DUF1508 domain-containing protein [uncultured Bartonella sp.]